MFPAIEGDVIRVVSQPVPRAAPRFGPRGGVPQFAFRMRPAAGDEAGKPRGAPLVSRSIDNANRNSSEPRYSDSANRGVGFCGA